ncbi:MAG: methylmalonyl-CoA epimerase [Dehalococcoidia bacterium]
MIDRVHHVGVVVKSADAALGFYRDVMGLEVTEDRVMSEQGVRGVLLALGENEIELLQPTADDSGVARFLESRGETLHHICLNTDDVAGELSRLKAAGVELIDEVPREGLAGQIAFVHPSATNGVLIEFAQPPAGAHSSTEKGFDHLAVVVADMADGAASWKQVAGLEVTNEIRPPGARMVIGQMPCGQCMIELLTPDGDDSPMAARIADGGERAASMVAIEVDDMEAEIARYRASGIELPNAEPGALPNSVRTSISAEQAFGLSIQLISFTA